MTLLKPVYVLDGLRGLRCVAGSEKDFTDALAAYLGTRGLFRIGISAGHTLYTGDNRVLCIVYQIHEGLAL